MSKKYLVIVRAGDQSLHPQWLATGGERNWDLLVSYRGQKPDRYPPSGEGVVRVDSEGPKWPALHALLSGTRAAWESYDYVWLPDDDLAADCNDINRMFELMRGLELHLAQPALSRDSHARRALASHNSNFSVRYASFVEPCAAAFSRMLLQRAAPTFAAALDGFALASVWPTLLDQPAVQCAILDCVQVTATRRLAATSGIEPQGSRSPLREVERLSKAHDAAAPLQVIYGGLDRDGRRTALFGDNGEAFIFRLCEGYLDHPDFDASALGALFAEHAAARRAHLDGAARTTTTRLPDAGHVRTPSAHVATGANGATAPSRNPARGIGTKVLKV